MISDLVGYSVRPNERVEFMDLVAEVTGKCVELSEAFIVGTFVASYEG